MDNNDYYIIIIIFFLLLIFVIFKINSYMLDLSVLYYFLHHIIDFENFRSNISIRTLKICDKMKLGCDYFKAGNHLHLCHFVAFPLPAKPLIVQRIIIGPDENRLPVNETASPFADMKHVKILGFRCFLPLFTSRNVVTTRTQFFMEGDSRTSLQHLNL